jgi:hypothetical protein
VIHSAMSFAYIPSFLPTHNLQILFILKNANCPTI